MRFVCALGGCQWRFVPVVEPEGALDPGVPHCPCPLPSPPHTNRLCKTIYLCDCLCGGPQGRAAEDEVRVCVASIHPAHFLARNVVLMPHVPPCTAQGTPQTQPVYLRAGKTYGKPIFGVGFDLIKNLRENLFKNL